MQFYHHSFPSSALIDRSINTLKDLFRINGWGPSATSATVWVYKSNENHATFILFYVYMVFVMLFYLLLFQFCLFYFRSIYTLKNLFRINGWGPLATFATVWVYISKENHAAGMVHALQQGILNAILPSTLPIISRDTPDH